MGKHSESNGEGSYLRRGGLGLVAIGVVGFAADYSLNIGLSRVLDTFEYGDYKVARNFAVFFSAAVLLGGDRACPRTLTGALERGESERVWGYLLFYLKIALSLSFLVIAITWISSYFLVGETDPSAHHPIAWLALTIPILATGALASRALQSAKRPVRATLPWRVMLPLLILLVVLAWSLTDDDMTLMTVVAIAILVTLVVSAWQIWDAQRLALPRLALDSEISERKHWIAVSLPMIGFFLVTLGLAQSDIYLMEILGDEHEVGLYAAVETTAHLLVLIQTIVIGLMAPLVSLAIESGAKACAKTRRQGLVVMLCGLVPATALLYLAGAPILGLFGAHFRVAETELYILLVGNFAWALAALAALWMQYTGRGFTVMVIAGAALLVDSALNVALIPHYGMRGAAASTAATLVLAAMALAISSSFNRRRARNPGN